MAEEVFNQIVVEKLTDIVKKKFSLSKPNYMVDKASEKGDNYLGLVYRVTVTSTEEPENKEFSIIVKIPPQNLFRRNQFFARPSFLREALAYEEFLPLIDEYQRNKDIDDAEIFAAYPKCYGTLTEEMNEAIFLEDLSSHNFQLFDRFKQLDISHVEVIMISYAKLHAISFSISKDQPHALYRFKCMQDVLAQRNDVQMLIYYEALIKRAVSSLNDETDSKYKSHLENYFKQHKFHDLLIHLLDGKNADPYAVVCHGDCWNNNILFQYEDTKPRNVCLLDWQIMRYASPITDLLYFLFTSTTAEFRRNHYEEVLNIYYQALTNHLNRLGHKVEDLYPRIQFDLDLKKFGAVGLLFAMIVVPLITTSPEDVANLDELGELIESGGTINDLNNSSFLDGGKSELYNERMRGVIIDMIDLKYI